MMNYKVQDKCSKGSIVVDLSSSDFSFVMHLFLLLSITSFFLTLYFSTVTCS